MCDNGSGSQEAASESPLAGLGTSIVEALAHQLNAIVVKKLEQPDFTASVRAGSPSLVVTAQDLIPEVYWVPQAPKLSRQALLTDLKQGAQVSGAQLSNAQPVLMVRTK